MARVTMLDACVLIAHLDEPVRTIGGPLGPPRRPGSWLSRAHTGPRMPDCCVLLAAEASGADLAPFDERLARVAAARG